MRYTTIPRIKKPPEDMFDAARTGQLSWLKHQFESEKISLREKNAQGITVFEIAARTGYVDIVQWVHQTLNTSNKRILPAERSARTALEAGHFEVLRYLNEHFKIQILSTQNYSPFEYPAQNGQLEMLKYCIEHLDTDVDITSHDHSALRWATANGHLDVVEYLLDERPEEFDIQIQDNFAIRWSARNGHLDVVKYLHEKFQLLDDLELYIQVVKFTVSNEQLDVLKYLISEEFAKHSDEFSQLYSWLLRQSARQSTFEMFEYLLKQEIDLDEFQILDFIRTALVFNLLEPLQKVFHQISVFPDLTDRSRTDIHELRREIILSRTDTSAYLEMTCQTIESLGYELFHESITTFGLSETIDKVNFQLSLNEIDQLQETLPAAVFKQSFLSEDGPKILRSYLSTSMSREFRNTPRI